MMQTAGTREEEDGSPVVGMSLLCLRVSGPLKDQNFTVMFKSCCIKRRIQQQLF